MLRGSQFVQSCVTTAGKWFLISSADVDVLKHAVVVVVVFHKG